MEIWECRKCCVFNADRLCAVCGMRRQDSVTDKTAVVDLCQERLECTAMDREMEELVTRQMVALSLNEKECLLNLLQLDECSLWEAARQLQEQHEMFLLHELCKYGHTDLVEFLIESGFDVNQPSSQGTPLQVTCQYGHAYLVERLLSSGADIVSPDVPVWSENSPFYIASRYGHIEVVKSLLTFQPSMCNSADPAELVKAEATRSCLLYAACLGGNLDLVKIWCSPGMDISHPMEIVTSFSDCEQRTPLYAACEGGHDGVVEFLLDIGAQLTGEICNKFPKVIGSALSNCVHESNDSDQGPHQDSQHKWYYADYSSRKLDVFNSDWLTTYAATLVDLDISNNNIEDLPDSVPWSLPNLKFFTAVHNFIKIISPPKHPEEIAEMRLEEVLLSHNKLEELCHEMFQIPSLKLLNVNYNQLQYLVKCQHQTTDISLQTNTVWNCRNLSSIDVSNNCLEMLPLELRTCTGLTRLNASNNKLCTFPSPWDTKLCLLDLSHNCLPRFPPSVEQFWCGTLKYLNLGHNEIEEVNEGIVKLCVLTDLNLSCNEIHYLPSPHIWDCGQLFHLDLSNNFIGGRPLDVDKQKRKMVFNIFVDRPSTVVTQSAVEFPDCLANCLHELYLRNNNLNRVPLSICHLRSLDILDLSDNPGITKLPKEMGLLRRCGLLKLSGLELTNIPQDLLKSGETKEIISYLRVDLRQSQKYNKMKLVVLGKKDKGKTSLVDLFTGKEGQCGNDIGGIHRREITLPPPRQKNSKIFQKDTRPHITFSVWDMAGDEEYTVINPCFFTPNSVYLLVWDLSSISKEQNQLGKWIYNIQARTPNTRVILVGTFMDRLKLSKKIYIDDLKEKLNRIFLSWNSESLHQRMEKNFFCAVSCITKEGIEDLKNLLYQVAYTFPDPSNRHRCYIGRRVPKSYIAVESALTERLQWKHATNKPPFISEEEFQEIIVKIPNNDIDTVEEHIAVTKFLVDSGLLLHFDAQMKGLKSLYFLDPTWLCEVLCKVLLDKNDVKLVHGGKIDMKDVEALYKADELLPVEFIPQCIMLLECFEIGLRTDKDRKLFVPSKLPKTHPGIDISLDISRNATATVFRLYRMDYVPSGLWSRLLTRLMMRIEQFSSVDWWFMPELGSVRRLSRKTHKNVTRTRSRYGLQFKLTEKVYWREGMWVRHDKGYFKVESIKKIVAGNSGISQQGILITVQSREDDFSVMGIIVDEIDNIIQDHYPGLLDLNSFTHKRFQSYAVCPNCFGQIENEMPNNLDHFTVEHCARIMLSCDTIPCVKGSRVPLSQLVPEFFMKELPSIFLLNYDMLVFDEAMENCLGLGVTGTVYRGTYGSMDVAVKVYHAARKIRSQYSSVDSGAHTMTSSIGSEPLQTNLVVDDDYDNWSYLTKNCDSDEAGSIKAWQAFSEMRQEVAIVSKLRHPCVISFVGVMLRPRLLLVLELAHLGSLRKVLDSQLENREPFNKHRDKHKVFKSVFGKDLTYKIIYQISKGLNYLHKADIIYRDLKSDNILITSLDLDSTVNVKLSDYGISKFGLSEGTVGMVGTAGYQAPELLEGIAYDEKVDIFSLAMVMYEVISGSRPYQEYASLSQMSRAIRLEAKRPSLKGRNTEPDFPFLEDLMERCWSSSSETRPSADEIVSRSNMKSVQFLCQVAEFHTPDKHCHGLVDAITSVQCHSDGGQIVKPLVWLWEGENMNRRYSIIDLSVNTYHVYCQPSRGSRATCISKVNKEMWVGTEAGEIEVFGRGSVGPPSCQYKLEGLKSVPTAILSYIGGHGLNIEETSKVTKVFVTTEDGRLLIFQPIYKPTLKRQFTDPSSQSEKVSGGWGEKKSLQFAEKPATCMAIVEHKSELWIGCSDTIVIVNMETLLVEDRLSLASSIVSSSGCPRNVLDIVYGDYRIWCFVSGMASILEFDTELHLQTHLFNCNESFPMHSIVAKYCTNIDVDAPIDEGAISSNEAAHNDQLSKVDVTNINNKQSDAPPTAQGISCSQVSGAGDEEHEGASTSEFKRNDECEIIYSRHFDSHESHISESSGDESCEDFHNVVPETNSSTSFMQHMSHNLNIEVVSMDLSDVPPPLPHRNRLMSESSNLPLESPASNTHRLSFQPLSSSNKDFCKPKKEKLKSSDKKSVSQGDNPNIRPPVPPLPPKYIKNRNYSHPPELPPRKGRPVKSPLPDHFALGDFSQQTIIVRSIAVVGDTLWVGRNCGDILVININSKKISQFQQRQVIAILRPMKQNVSVTCSQNSEEMLKLLHIGHVVISLQANFDLKEKGCSTRLASWEDYGLGQVNDIHHYWNKIENVEQKLHDEDMGHSEL